MAKVCLLIFTLILVITAGCSGGSGLSPVEPENDGITDRLTDGISAHISWGIYRMEADIALQTLDVTPLRAAQFHLNALPFVEPPPLVNMTIESLQFNGNIIEVDIGLRHPFLGLTEFTGFDVCGILISNGSYSGFSDTALTMAGPGDTYLQNPDGLARWWNPTEFPPSPSPIYGYVDGLLGTPDSQADFNSTLNGYKYFCDDLNGTDDPMSMITLANRGKFSAGQKNVRHYTIELGSAGLVFNYAIDACWQYPTGDPPWAAPESFADEANRTEPYRIEVIEIANTLYADNSGSGGELSLSIDVYDWFSAEMNSLYIEAADSVLAQVGPITPIAGGSGFSTYELDIATIQPITSGELDLLITIETEEADFAGFISGTPTSAYFIHKTLVGDEGPSVPTDPVIIDDNGCFGTVLAIDENDVIHSGYAASDNLFWSYSTNQGSSWTNFDSIYSPSGDLYISTSTLSMCPGPGDGYVYISWAERSVTTPHRALWAGRMPVDLSGDFETVMVWEHTSGASVQGYDGTQILAMDNGEFLIYAMFYYQSGGGFRPVYNRVVSFLALEGCPELVVNNYLSGGSLVYIYTGWTKELDADSNSNAYFLNSGRFNDPGYNRGSFILENSVSTGAWNFFESYTPTGNYNNVMYWDNRNNSIFIDDNDVIHAISEWQTGGYGNYGGDAGTYYMIYGTGPAGGTITWTDPIPDMTRGTAIPGYPGARLDDEWVSSSVVEDGNGLVYHVFQDCENLRDAYYVTYDGASWNHTDNWVKINTTTGQYAFHPYAIRGLDGYVYVTYTDASGSIPGVPVFVAVIDQ